MGWWVFEGAPRQPSLPLLTKEGSNPGPFSCTVVSRRLMTSPLRAGSNNAAGDGGATN